jgi:predicted AAA+ superfamily ATPase
MNTREAKLHLRKLASFFPVLAITGPRQSGKTTLARNVFGSKPYVSLENPDILWGAESDPRGFLAKYPDGAIFDEAQRFPALFSYLQQIVDKNPTPGRYILTGSRQFDLRSRISQSLAGRVGLIHLHPFATNEWYTTDSLPPLDNILYQGLYPPVLDRNIPPEIWFPQYVATYVERDVRDILPVRDIGAFSRFIRLCAGRVGQLLNLSSLASDVGITHNTAKAWIDVLEASYLIIQLQPWHENFGKRLIKTPKLYFTDTGLLCWLLGIANAEQLSVHSMRGSIFENWVIMDTLKHRRNIGIEPNLYFWRDQAGLEVDLLQIDGTSFVATEIKSGMTLSQDSFKGLKSFAKLAKDRLTGLQLIYGGDGAFTQLGVEVQGWKEFSRAIRVPTS